MQRDTFLHGGTAAEPVVKGIGHVDVQKVGWTDEAREAAALARQKGYVQTNDMRSGSLKFKHMNGHSLHIAPNGDWGHVESKVVGDVRQDAKMSNGHGADSLHDRLSNLHGLGTGPTSRDLAQRDAQVTHDEKLSNAKPTRALSVPEQHQHRIAQQTLRMNPAMAGVMGGPNHEESRAILSRNTGLPAHPSKGSFDGTLDINSARARNHPLLKQAPIGPRVIEVDEDQDSIAREEPLLRPGQTTDAPEAGGALFRPIG